MGFGPGIKKIIFKKMAAPKKGTKSTGPIFKFKGGGKVTRKGIHAKTKQSKAKSSKNYVKVSRGQG